MLAALETVVAALIRRRGHRRAHEKFKNNPYASRGLDKFTLLSAYLAENRRQLALQLGSPESVVRFAAGPHSKWIPIIIAPSKMKESGSRNATALINGELSVGEKLQAKAMAERSSSSLPGMAEEGEAKRSSLTETKGGLLTTLQMGLLIVLMLLLWGRIVAIVGVLCWWYALPFLRQALDDHKLPLDLKRHGNKKKKMTKLP